MFDSIRRFLSQIVYFLLTQLKRSIVWNILSRLLRFFRRVEPETDTSSFASAFFVHLYKLRRIENPVNGCEYVGLNTSAELTVQTLVEGGARAEAIGVLDDNGIDRVLFNQRPSHLIIKAFWVRPAKLEMLAKKYPSCQFIICCHSNPSFLAMEGRGFELLTQIGLIARAIPNVRLAANNFQTADFVSNGLDLPCVYLPNLVPVERDAGTLAFDSDTVKIGLFCSIRPLKNVASQAAAAILWARKFNKKLEFHILVGRNEMGGGPVLKSLQDMFTVLDPNQFKLVEHPWMKHPDFLNLIDQMHLGLQVSYTESFNIVTCDFMRRGRPVVTSPAVAWTPKEWHANPDSIHDIMDRISWWLNMTPEEQEFQLEIGRFHQQCLNDESWETYRLFAREARVW